MNIIKWIMQWFERRRVRRELLATPGVDLLVQRVMDAKYGKHGWRVVEGCRMGMPCLMLEADVSTPGSSTSFWGLIGPIHAEETRAWLRAGGRPPGPEVSHAKDAPYKIEPPDEERWYDQNYVDTEPLDDDGRTEK